MDVVDYVAMAREAARRWREANGIPLDADLSTLPSLNSRPREEKKDAPRGRDSLAREESAKQAIKAKEGEEREAQRGAGRWSVIVGRTVVDLDPAAVREVLGVGADDHDLAILKLDVGEALARYLNGVRDGQLPPRQLVRGVPLADLLDLADVAALLREGARQ